MLINQSITPIRRLLQPLSIDWLIAWLIESISRRIVPIRSLLKPLTIDWLIESVNQSEYCADQEMLQLLSIDQLIYFPMIN